MPLQIVRENIVHMHTDAIVNAANSHLRPGGGVCGAIFDAAGYEDMRRACEALGYCAPGEAVITPGFGLPARYVIHAVGPVWQGGAQGEERLLRACYRNCLELALSRGLGSIAFPLISSGDIRLSQGRSAGGSGIGDIAVPDARGDAGIYCGVRCAVV